MHAIIYAQVILYKHLSLNGTYFPYKHLSLNGTYFPLNGTYFPPISHLQQIIATSLPGFIAKNDVGCLLLFQGLCIFFFIVFFKSKFFWMENTKIPFRIKNQTECLI